MGLPEPTVLGDAVNNTFRLAKGLLDVAVEALNVNVPATQAAPDRVFVYHTEPPADTEQLSVYVDSPRPSQTFPLAYDGPILTPFFWVADLVVTLLRPYPTGVDSQGRLLPMDVFTRASELLYADGHCIYWSLTTALVQLRNSGCFDYYALSALRPLAPEGGLAGWAFTITTEISGDCSCLAEPGR